MSQLGLGAMIHMLGGNSETVAKYNSCINKKIASLKLDRDANDNDGALQFVFEDDSEMELYDGARSCCESRWMHTDDDLEYFVGSDFLSIELLCGPTETSEYGDGTESMFVHISTSKGKIVLNTYNSHNGYYGGIAISIR